MFRCYRQLEHSDCGLTCIRMVARHFGKKIPLRHLNGISDLSRLGMSVKDITECLGKIGMSAIAVKIGEPEALRMPLPAILYWRQRHFVVLYKISRNGKRFHIADPAQGRTVYGHDEFMEYWLTNGASRGIAIVAEPTEEFHGQIYENDNPVNNLFSYIFRRFRQHSVSFSFVMLLLLLIMAADFAMPILLRHTIDKGIASKDMGIVMALLLCQMAVTTGSLVSSKGMNLLMSKLGLRIDLEMVTDFLTQLTKFPMSFFDRKVSSDFIQKINDQSRIKDFLISFPNTVIVLLLNLIVFSILLCSYSPLIFGIFIGLSIVEIGWSALFLNKRKALNFTLFVNSSENRNHAYELTNGMAELKANNAETVRLSKWRHTQEKINATSMKSEWINTFSNGGQMAISKIKELTVTGLSAMMVIEGDMTFGIMMTLGYITGRLAQPFSLISSSVQSVLDATLSYERIADVHSTNNDETGKIKFHSPSIRFENVWFKYPGGSSPYVIKDFSCTIPVGKVTAIVGESGCGKSTLVKLMLGFYNPQKGSLFLGNNPVNDTDTSDWLSHCGVVMQNGYIFTGSILENISLSEENPDISKATEALSSVCLSEFIKGLPMGINTRIGVSGIEMSGGQKQRLMIARALYKNPDLLFLDEATSSLDANNERCIVNNIREFGRGKTVVVAAHRLSTVCDADQIIFIKDGQISEIGSHDELIALGGDYWNLVKNQLNLSI